MAVFCEKYFYPEESFPQCDYMITKRGVCKKGDYCTYQLNLSKERLAVLNNLRIVKLQNAEILKQNKQILDELALQQLQKLK